MKVIVPKNSKFYDEFIKNKTKSIGHDNKKSDWTFNM